MKFTKNSNVLSSRLTLTLLVASTLTLTACSDDSVDSDGFTHIGPSQDVAEIEQPEPVTPSADTPMKYILEEKTPGKYVLAEIVPVVGVKLAPGEIMIVKRDANGYETVIPKVEVEQLFKEEEKAYAAGTSELAQDIPQVTAPVVTSDQLTSSEPSTSTAAAPAPQGLSFGGAIMASMIGTTMGNMMSSGSNNYSDNRQFNDRQSSFVGGAASQSATRYGSTIRYSNNSSLSERASRARAKSKVLRSSPRKPVAPKKVAPKKVTKPRIIKKLKKKTKSAFKSYRPKSKSIRSSGSRSSRGG